MARADLLRRLLASYQRRDDRGFREAASELISEERKKHHEVLAEELQRILSNGAASSEHFREHEPLPLDQDRKMPLVQVRRPDRYFDDLVLSKELASGIERALLEFRSWEVLDANGLSPTRRLLFVGPPGCGKTVTAEAIATDLGIPMLYVRFDAVVSSLLGETAANLRRVFDYASRGQWVLFFDEFDAIGRSRDDATEHGEIKRVVNSFLQLLDGFHGRSLVIAATNFEQALDPALWRRFDDIIRFGRPDASGLRRLVERRLARIQLPLRLKEEISENLCEASYADAERLCLDIRKACALAGTDVASKDLVNGAIARWRLRSESVAGATPHADPHITSR